MTRKKHLRAEIKQLRITLHDVELARIELQVDLDLAWDRGSRTLRRLDEVELELENHRTLTGAFCNLSAAIVKAVWS